MTSKRATLPLAVLIGVSLATGRGGVRGQESTVIPLPAAHAHNDYWHQRPLLDALSYGFCSVEADVFFVDGKLLVGHERSELRPERTLQALYLEPLKKRIEQNHGKVYTPASDFTLLIDIKSDGEATYEALHTLLTQYADILTSVTDAKPKRGPVTIVISGNRPTKLLAAQKTRYAGVDGRLSDLNSAAPAHLLPMLSDNWQSHFKWRGEGPFQKDEQQKLTQAVKAAHAAGRRIRFWGVPEEPHLWHVLRTAGVDLISTDDLAALQRFLLRPAKVE
jgi:hypothetical protein